MKHVAKRIRAVRGTMKQWDFAEKIGINPNTLRNYENGRVLPNQEVLANICLAFSVSPEWLLLGAGSMTQGENQEKDHSPPVGMNKDLLQDVVETVEEFLIEDGSGLAPRAKAELVYQLYMLLSEEETDAKQPLRIVRMLKGAVAAEN